jgi:hypothetical protein
VVASALDRIELGNQGRLGCSLPERTLDRIIDVTLVRIEIVFLEIPAVGFFGFLRFADEQRRRNS